MFRALLAPQLVFIYPLHSGGKIGLRQREALSFISSSITYDHNKFGDDSSTPAEEDVWELGKLAQKKDFVMKIVILQC